MITLHICIRMHVKLEQVKFAALWVTVKLPENVSFTPTICNPDDAVECYTMFKFVHYQMYH